MTPLEILHCWLQIWCLKCCVAFPVACGVINCGGLAPPLNLAKIQLDDTTGAPGGMQRFSYRPSVSTDCISFRLQVNPYVSDNPCKLPMP